MLINSWNLTASLNTNRKFPAFIWIFNDASWKEVVWTYWSGSTGSSLTKVGQFELGDNLGHFLNTYKNASESFHQITLTFAKRQLDTLQIKNCPGINFSCHAVWPWCSVELQHVTVKQETVIIVITQGENGQINFSSVTTVPAWPHPKQHFWFATVAPPLASRHYTEKGIWPLHALLQYDVSSEGMQEYSDPSNSARTLN